MGSPFLACDFEQRTDCLPLAKDLNVLSTFQSTNNQHPHHHIEATMERSPLARLAPETRNYIYELVLDTDHSLLIAKYNGGPRLHSTPGQQAPQLSLVRTCRTIRNEATSMFYALRPCSSTLSVKPPTSSRRTRTLIPEPAQTFPLPRCTPPNASSAFEIRTASGRAPAPHRPSFARGGARQE